METNTSPQVLYFCVMYSRTLPNVYKLHIQKIDIYSYSSLFNYLLIYAEVVTIRKKKHSTSDKII